MELDMDNKSIAEMTIQVLVWLCKQHTTHESKASSTRKLLI